MGPEQTLQSSEAPASHQQTINLLDVHKLDVYKAAVQNPDQASNKNAGSSALATAVESRRTENPVIDFSAPVYPAEKAAQFDKPAVARPANKYEAAVNEQVTALDGEAKFTPYTRDALSRDADKYPPSRNEKDGTTTYTIEQVGLTDRDLAKGQDKAEHYKRLVTITVPDKADSLKDCKFAYQDRQNINEKEFNALVDRAQTRQGTQAQAADEEHRLPRSDDMAFYTHGIRTGAESADFQALALQLTQGHAVINVDWKSTAPSEEKLGLSEAYSAERKGAAASYGRMEKALDDTISHIGADHTDMIAFSHGAMFDTRYLRHRNQSHAPLLNEVILTHPDVPIAELAKPDKDGKLEPSKRLYACAAKNTHVIGSTADLAMTGAAYNDCEPSKSDSWLEQLQEKNRQMAIHARIGDGGKISRTLVEGHGGTYVMETVPEDKKDALKHFINMHGITKLINHQQTLVAKNEKPEGE